MIRRRCGGALAAMGVVWGLSAAGMGRHGDDAQLLATLIGERRGDENVVVSQSVVLLGGVRDSRCGLVIGFSTYRR